MIGRAVWGILLAIILLLAACRQPGEEQPTAPPPAATTGSGVAGGAETAGQPATEEAGQRGTKPERAAAAEVESQTPAPLPTPDPELPEWTVLVYMMADNEQDGAALRDLNQMEAAGESVRVNVVAQVDRAEGAGEWSGARRYEIHHDEDLAEIASPLQEDLGETNTGDPDSLSEFVAWGVQNYPANRYALLLWDQGGNWAALGSDGSHEGDALPAPDLAGALQRGLEQTDRSRLDLIGFDVPFSSHVQIYDAVHPFATVAVATPEVVSGWAYQSWLQSLFTQPSKSAQQLALEIAGATGVELAVVNLAAYGAVSQAWSALASELMANPEAFAAAKDARDGAVRTTMPVTAGDTEDSLVDLWHFASILSERSSEGAITVVARQLMQALEGVAVAAEEGAAESLQGEEAAARPVVAFSFPSSAEQYIREQLPPDLSTWNEFLQQYFAAAEAQVAAPQVTVSHTGGITNSAHHPAYLGLELGGRMLKDAHVVAGRREEDGRLRLVQYDRLLPRALSLPGGHTLYPWRDGIHKEALIWNATTAYATDGANGEFVVLWPTAGDERRFAVHGQFVEGETEARSEATLIFDAATQALQQVWQAGPRAAATVAPQNGDSFQLYTYYLGADQELSYEPGVTLVFTEGTSIRYDYYPLPTGQYAVGVAAETVGGTSNAHFADVVVNNDELTPGYKAYLDPSHGFQFIYPVSWSEPRYEGGRLLSWSPERENMLSLTVYPELTGRSANDLKAETLQMFGGVSVLYEETITVAGNGALLTAYGYDDEEGQNHTGVFITFIDTGRRFGFVVDVDGPAEVEAETMEVARQIAASWQFREVGIDRFPAQWSRMEIGELNVAVPSGYSYEQLENGWERFSGGEAFVALRREPLSHGGRPAIVRRWLDVAASGVERFEAGEMRQVTLAEKGWSRADFSYGGEGNEMRGFVMATIVGGEEFVAWAEMPAGVYEQLEQDQFLLLIADAAGQIPGESGLLYQSNFDEAGSWGVGDMEGASGVVSDGLYRMSVTAEEGFFWTTAGESLSDGSFEVQTVQQEGPLDNGFGLLIRAEREAERFYVFEISGDGYVWIGLCQQSCASARTLVGDGWFYSEAVRQGLQVSNQLRVEADGGALRFVVNGVEVGSVQDEALAAGDIGLFVETLGEGGVTVAFDNVQVEAP